MQSEDGSDLALDLQNLIELSSWEKNAAHTPPLETLETHGDKALAILETLLLRNPTLPKQLKTQ